MIRADRFSTPWGQLIMKIVQIVCLFLAAVMAGAWNSNDTQFTDLNSDDANQRSYFVFLIVISIGGIIWAVASIILLFPVKQAIPPLVLVIVNSILTLLVLIASSLFISGIVSLSESSVARTKDLDLKELEAACFFSIMATVAYIGDLVLEIIACVFTFRMGPEKLYLASCCDE